MPAKRQFLLAGVAALLCLGALFTLWSLDPVVLQSWRLAQFDQFQRWSQRPVTPLRVGLVDIDEASLQKYGQWPWPRTLVAELTRRLQQAGAKVIVFDVLLAESDRTSPKALAQLWNNAQASALLQTLPDHDQLLANTFSAAPVVLGGFLLNAAPNAHLASALPSQSELPYRMVVSAAGAAKTSMNQFDRIIAPLPILSAHAAGLGVINMATADGDGVVRRVPLLLRLDEQIVPGLVAEAFRVATGARNYVLQSDALGVRQIHIGQAIVPTNDKAEMWLDYRIGLNLSARSAEQILNGDFAAGQFRDRIALIGTSAAGLFDLRFNPLGQLMPGVQAHALALEQLLSQHYLVRPAWARALEALVLLLGSLLVAWLALRLAAWRAALFTAALLLPWCAAVWYAFARANLLLDGVNPALAILLSYSLASVVHHLLSEREKRWVKNAFSRYVSPNRVRHLIDHPEQLQLGGQRQQCSFVFTDLADFTGMLESSDPAEVVDRLNAYLESMLAIAFKHEGTLERIMGDALAVLFSAPVQQSDYRQRALDCALEMDDFARRYAQQLQAQGITWGQTRIGVHAGEVIVGNFGGKTLFDYRALGDPVNTAARLESVNKTLGTRICVSAAIVDGCPGVPVRPVGRLLLKGKKEALRAFEPLAATDPAQCAPAADYALAMQSLRAGRHASALAQFEALASAFANDPLVALHTRRLRQGVCDDLIVLSEK